MANREIWEEVWNRFDPERPAEKPAWRVSRDRSPATQICDELSVPMGGIRRYVILGSMGSGKSTELLAIADARRLEGPVVFLDLIEHFLRQVGDRDALEHVQAWEILLLIGLGVYRAVDMFGHEWAKEDLAELEAAGQAFAAADGDQPSFDLAKLASSVAVMAGGALGSLGGPAGVAAGAGLTLASKAADAGRWQFRIGRRDRKRSSDQDSRVQQLLAAVNGLIGVVHAKYATELTVFVDGLDRIENLSTTRALFVDSTLLASLSCPTIVTASLALRRETLAPQVRVFRPKVLSNLPVIDHRNPWSFEPGGPGIEVCVEVFRRRVTDLDPDCISPPLLRKLGYYSGGRLREFVRFVRFVSERSYSRDAAVDELIVDEVIDEWRRLLEMGINRRHLELLESLLDTPELPDDDKVSDMLNRGWILPYPNESEWYFPHPLLLKVKLAGRRG